MSNRSAKVKVAKRVERFVWLDVTLTATHTPNYLSDGWSHIELSCLPDVQSPTRVGVQS